MSTCSPFDPTRWWSTAPRFGRDRRVERCIAVDDRDDDDAGTGVTLLVTESEGGGCVRRRRRPHTRDCAAGVRATFAVVISTVIFDFGGGRSRARCSSASTFEEAEGYPRAHCCGS
jgi:hypothetical protein